MTGDFDAIFAALAAADVRYLVVGGVAVVLHGHTRFTSDLDLVVSLEEANARRALTALNELGYRPRAPVDALAFADEPTRRSWIEEKHMTVFSLWSPSRPATSVDLFVKEPFDFDEALGRALHVDLDGVTVTAASIRDLVALKRVAGRAKDIEDIAELLAIEELRDAH
jgi:hypothetical protein